MKTTIDMKYIIFFVFIYFKNTALGNECPPSIDVYFLKNINGTILSHPVNITSIYFCIEQIDHFNLNHSTKVIIHGYNSDMNTNGLYSLRYEYLKHEIYNIFVIDWSPLSKSINYPKVAIDNTRKIGKCLAQFIQHLVNANVQDLHILGYSLGAHIAGFVAESLKPYKIPRITGLDPAKPGFLIVPNAWKLDKSDAEFVDVYHTNSLIQGKFSPSGHVDFFMNGGLTQPGCGSKFKDKMDCSHERACIYFAESINSKKGFWGWSCQNYLKYLLGYCPSSENQILAGEYINKSEKGFYLITTNSEAPFALGQIPSKNSTKLLDKIKNFFKNK